MFKRHVIQCLRDLPSSFRKRELAYLVLTGKAESHLRDHIAFGLQRALAKHLVCREWQHHDIAIIEQGSDVAQALIEIKAFYTFDGVVPNKLRRVRKALLKDVRKMRDSAPRAERMALLFLTHPQTTLPRKLHEAFAYDQVLNSVYHKSAYGGPERIAEAANQSLVSFWKKEVRPKWLRKGEYSPGKYQGIEARVLYSVAGL